jgi:hypothetical protein
MAKRYRPVGQPWEAVLQGAAQERDSFLSAVIERYADDEIGIARRDGDTVSLAGDLLRHREGLWKTYKVGTASWTTATAIGRHLSINWTLAIEDSAIMQVLAEQGKLRLDDPALRAFARVALEVTQAVTQDFALRAGSPLAAEQLEPSGIIAGI